MQKQKGETIARLHTNNQWKEWVPDFLIRTLSSRAALHPKPAIRDSATDSPGYTLTNENHADPEIPEGLSLNNVDSTLISQTHEYNTTNTTSIPAHLNEPTNNPPAKIDRDLE